MSILSRTLLAATLAGALLAPVAASAGWPVNPVPRAAGAEGRLLGPARHPGPKTVVCPAGEVSLVLRRYPARSR